jgi:CAAX prenyl protease-like protein
VITGVDARWVYAVQAGVALLALLACRTSYSELAAAPRLARSLAISVGAGIAVFPLWIAPMPGWLHLGAPVASFVPVDGDGLLRWERIGARALGAVLVAPLMEELFWRSFLMRWIDRRDFLSLTPASVSWFGVFASSAVFALTHDVWLARLIAGLVLRTDLPAPRQPVVCGHCPCNDQSCACRLGGAPASLEIL